MIAQGAHGKPIDRRLGGGAEARDPSDVLRPGTTVELLAATPAIWHQRRAAPHEKRSDTRRTTKLVSREADKVDAKAVNVDRCLAHSLNRVAVHERPCATRKTYDLANRLQHAGLVVGEHHRYERRRSRGCKHAFENREIDDAIAVHRNSLRIGTSPAHAVVLDSRCDHAGCLCARKCQGVGLGAARREHDLGRQCTNQGSHLATRLVDDRPRPAA